ncbi:MAG TPA: oligoendopeptidase F, partial [Acholeplasmataceae bacterium]|nr:oligoendopeptidase F [Acholeplasmataceae bacterium]
MKKQLPKRHELDVKHTWDMTNLFKNETLYLEAFDLLEKDVDLFCMTYETKLNTAEIINDAITFFQDMQGSISRISAYGSLQSSTDSISEENQMRQGKAMIRFQTISKKMSFFINELKL